MRLSALLLTLCCFAGAAPAETLELALDAFRDGHFAAAESRFGELLKVQPDDLPARYWRGRARLAQGDRDGAIADFQQVLEVKPDSLPSRLWLARTYDELGRVGEALAAYRQLLADDPSQTDLPPVIERLEAVRAAQLRLVPPPAGTAAGLADGLDEVASCAPGAPLGPHVAVSVDGLPDEIGTLVSNTGLDADGLQLLDYTFGSAPTEWEPAGGSWQVFSRFACDPSWSFFGGYSHGLAIVWNKRQFVGDLVAEAYVSFKHGLPFNSRVWQYRPADLCLTLCGDGLDPDSGYSFIYAGDEGSRTMIKRGTKILAETSDPAFLTPSYADKRPATEDFHRRWWRLEARRAEGKLEFAIDGKLALSVQDTEPIAGGRLAIWTVHNGMMIARVRVAYQQELRPLAPRVTLTNPVPLPDPAPAVAAAR